MSDEPNKTERQLKSSAGETPDLRGVIGEQDPEDVDVFGYQVIYTTGEFTLPRDALLDKMSDVGLPDWMAPGQVKPYRAFGRMIEDLVDEDEEIEFAGHRCRFTVQSGDSRYAKHVHISVFHSPEDDQINATEGKWIDHELGVVRYDSDTQGLTFVDRVDEDRTVAPLWYDGLKPRARDRFEEHQDLHTGDDVNNMVYYLCRQWTDAVKLRDSCYFVPAAYEGIEAYIDGFRELYAWIDTNYKTRGQSTELFAIEIMDSERQREMVEQKVLEEVRGEVGDIYDEIAERVREGAEYDAVANEVVASLDQVEGLAERHSAVLKTELSVKRAMKDVLGNLDEEREEVVEQVLAEAGLDPREEVAA